MDDESVMGRKRKPLTQTNDAALTAKKKRKNGTSLPTFQKRAGTITNMILKNFMCHSLLEVNLSENNINLIIGRNGSGKSAILTALVVGLGGKTSLTNRGNSVKGFVKAGKSSGSIEIHLYNGGPMAYRPNVYGSKIVIIRNFSAAGSSSYKIKAENGEVIATQVREIHNITTSLNIQIDNPVCILNQDTSRNFLSSNNPTHKFTLFMKATRLETLAEEYKKIAINKKESVRIFEEKRNNFEKLQEEMKVVKRKMDNHKSIISFRDKLKLMQGELLWAKVRDAEEELKKEEAKVAQIESKHQKVIDECENRKETIENIKKNISTLNQQISELKEAIQIQSRPQWDVKKVIDELRAKYNEKRQQKHLINSTIQSKTKDAEVLKNEIENANENMTRIQQEKMQRMRDLTSMSEKIKGMEDHLQTCRNDLYQLSNDINRKEEEKQNLRSYINQLDHQMSNERNSLNALKNESGNTLLLYGRDIPKIKNMIEQYKHKFTHPPRGPLGSYIKLKDKKWAVAVESFLTAGLLGSFTVDNTKDNQLLVQIFNQVWSGGRRPTIITSKFYNRKHDVRHHLVQAPSDCVSMYDALEIDDPVVANSIVDQAGIEGILLIPSDARARQLLSNAANVPRNCKQGLTVSGDKYYPDPNYRTYANRNKRAQYLQVDTKEHIIQLEQNISELAKKKQTVEVQLADLNKDIREQDSKKRQLEDKIRKLNSARSEIRRQLDDLKATAEPEVASVELLESELIEVRNVLKEKTAEMSRVEEQLKEIKANIAENEEKLGQLKDSNSSLEDRMRTLESQVNEDKIRQREIATSDEFDKRKAKEYESKLNEARSQMVVKQTTLNQYIREASKSGERQETARKVSDIVTEISQLERNVKRIETDTENTEDLVEKYTQMCDKLDKVSVLLNSLYEDIDELNLAIEKRSRHYKFTEKFFVSYIKHSFKKIMVARQFEGSIEINMQDKKLEMIVIPQHGSQGLTTTSNLSGGERSFSTVAFLYALWQCMEFPFYFLDEFDVYMDKLNRTKVIEILLNHAETHPDLQFVFLTPQDVSFIKKNVSILRLSDPERSIVTS